MIQIVEAKKPYEAKHADLICDFCEDKRYSKYLSQESLNSQKIIPLAVLYPDPWQALEALNIDGDPLHFKYKCPYTGYEHFAILPSSLIVNGDVNVYKDVKHHSPDYVLDWEWHQKMHKANLTGLTDIQKIMLGSGYTSGTRITDGHGTIKQCLVMLDNGDALLSNFWEWYNK